MILRKSFYIRWSAGRSPRVHEVNPGRDPSEEKSYCSRFLLSNYLFFNLSRFFSYLLKTFGGNFF